MKTCDEMISLFENANKRFLEMDKELFASRVSERTLCGALMLHLYCLMDCEGAFSDYHVDVEYNRNKGNLVTSRKTILGVNDVVLPINCDLIIHSRGNNKEQDNLIAIEMKKSMRPQEEKDRDRERLAALTRDSFNNEWQFDGNGLPEHVCRYVLGVYYEINYRYNEINVEYYHRGDMIDTRKFKIPV